MTLRLRAAELAAGRLPGSAAMASNPVDSERVLTREVRTVTDRGSVHKASKLVMMQDDTQTPSNLIGKLSQI